MDLFLNLMFSDDGKADDLDPSFLDVAEPVTDESAADATATLKLTDEDWSEILALLGKPGEAPRVDDNVDMTDDVDTPVKHVRRLLKRERLELSTPRGAASGAASGDAEKRPNKRRRFDDGEPNDGEPNERSKVASRRPRRKGRFVPSQHVFVPLDEL